MKIPALLKLKKMANHFFKKPSILMAGVWYSLCLMAGVWG
jgi:hypothetical protein